MACDCLERTLEEFKTKCVNPQMNDTPHVEGSVNSDWHGRVLFFSNEPKFPIPLKIITTYRPIKKDGTPAAKDKKLENNFIMEYCPLCGVKY